MIYIIWNLLFKIIKENTPKYMIMAGNRHKYNWKIKRSNPINRTKPNQIVLFVCIIKKTLKTEPN